MTILATSFLFNIIPFAGPSNLLIASNAAVLASVEPYIVGIMVAIGSATAKFIHYLVMFFLGKHVSKERRKRLDENSEEIKKWAMPALFIVAATPLPDEPVVIPLGLLKYNPGKLFLAYFAGKLLIGVVGAYLGIYAHTNVRISDQQRSLYHTINSRDNNHNDSLLESRHQKTRRKNTQKKNRNHSKLEGRTRG